MELCRVTLDLANLSDVPGLIADEARPVLRCRDANTVEAAAWLQRDLVGPLGVWLDVSGEYPAQLAARDLATLSWIIDVGDVVVAGVDATSQLEIVRVLLTNDEVNFANQLVTLRGAYNRPAPPRPLTLWSAEGTVLQSVDHRLVERSSRTTAGATFTVFA